MGSGLSKREIDKIRKETNYTVDQIHEWYTEFKQNARYGRFLDKTTFRTVYGDLFPGDASDFADSVFRTFDRDKNGRVDFEEFMFGLYVTASDNIELKLKWAFKMYDIDGNGVIEKDELGAIIQAVYKMHGSDVDISETALTDKLFREMDADGNGEISWEEFSAAARNDPKVLELLKMN